MRNCHNFINEWEKEDLKSSTKGSIIEPRNDGDDKERVFRKSFNACVTVYVPAVNRFYITICNDWFLEYYGDKLGKIYEFYIAEFSEGYSQLNNISAERQEMNVGNANKNQNQY